MTTHGGSGIGRVAEVFWVFLRLGCYAFGGPVAHLGYFQEALVERRRWVSARAYAELIALCQFLPGPASSQVGFALGWQRAGLAGAFAAWVGFTLPSAALMIAFAYGLGALDLATAAPWLHGLKLGAVAVVAQAVATMFPKLCPDAGRAALALVAAAGVLVWPFAAAHVVVIVAGALIGLATLRATVAEPTPEASTDDDPESDPGLARRSSAGFGMVALALFAALLAVAILLPTGLIPMTLSFWLALYEAGALVFGGGHVVLPLLDAFVVAPGWLGAEPFLAGYGAAQVLPGPLFAFSAFLGTAANVGPGGIGGGLAALVALYLPAWLLIFGTVPFWQRLRHRTGVRAALAGTNAAVVGLLLAALYRPLGTAAVTSPLALAIALVAFAALRYGKVPPWLVVPACAVAGGLLLAG